MASDDELRKWIEEGERNLQRETIEVGVEQDSLQASEDTLQASADWSSALRGAIDYYRTACELATPWDLPTYHQWNPADSDAIVPVRSGVSELAQRLAHLFGCSCEWQPLRNDFANVSFRGFDDNPHHAVMALESLLATALQQATRAYAKRRSELTAFTLLQSMDYLDGYSSSVAAEMAIFLEERTQSWIENGGRMQVVLYERPSTTPPEIYAPEDDADYGHGFIAAG